MEGALSNITAIPTQATEPKTAYFDGDGVTLAFVIVDPKAILIHSVYVGGQRWTEGEHYNVDNNAKTVTFIAPNIPEVGQGIAVTYFAGVSVGGIDLSNLSPAQLQALAQDLAPYII